MSIKTLLAASIASLVILGFLIYASLEQSSENVVQTTQEHSEQTAQTKPADKKEDKKDDFVYKVDPRRFDQNPNNIAAKEKWSADKDVMILVTPQVKNMKPFYIDAYEALISNYRAWSVPGVVPTDKLRSIDAQVACEASGKRLCSITEWQTACRGGLNQRNPYRNPNEWLKKCDFARSAGYDRNDYVNKTDSHPQCTPHGQYKIHHMLGNLSEFVEDRSGRIMIVGLTYYDANLSNKPLAMRNGCMRTVSSAGQYPEGKYNKGLGFRCCKDAR